jgi:hypothetical protein
VQLDRRSGLIHSVKAGRCRGVPDEMRSWAHTQTCRQFDAINAISSSRRGVQLIAFGD